MPSSNHLKSGAFDASSVRVKGFVQIRCWFASRAQNASWSRSASATSASYAARPEIVACATVSALGG